MKEFRQIIREIFTPDKVDVQLGAMKIQYSQAMRQDLADCIAVLSGKRVLFADIGHEIWEYSFKALTDIRQELIELDGRLSFSAPNDIKSCVEKLLECLNSYLAEYETDYILFMQGPLLHDLAPVHKERNWPALDRAADDLILLRKIFCKAIENLNLFTEKGKIIEWEDEFTNCYLNHIATWAKGRKLCKLCGWNLEHYKRPQCPYEYGFCREFDNSEKVFIFKGNATQVAVAGTFSKWQPLLLHQYDWLLWGLRCKISMETHQYKLIVDGQWITDPQNSKTIIDSEGNVNSIIN